MITQRKAEDIYQAHGQIEIGTFHGRWHFSFGEYYDPSNSALCGYSTMRRSRRAPSGPCTCTARLRW